MLVFRLLLGYVPARVYVANFINCGHTASRSGVPRSLCSMGVFFDSAAAAGAAVLSVFFAFGNILKDTHSLLEATSHICTQSCEASRGFDGERAALVALAVVSFVSLLRGCGRRGQAGGPLLQAEPVIADTPPARTSTGRRRQLGGCSQALAHLALDASQLEQWLR